MPRLIALILPLGLDTFAVAAALGMSGLPARQRVRVSVLFTAFEGAMPLVGLALGAPLGRAIGSSADYVAIVILIGSGSTPCSAETTTRPRGSQISSSGGRWPRWCSA
jgi:manganese efflux pump family protein